MRPFAAPPALVALALCAAACSSDKTQGLCVEDADCPAGFACDEGRCVCKSDASCQANEICNLAGFCQARVGCESSLDCPEGQFCDRTTGNCLDRERCTADVQCDLGQVCDTVRFQCVPGCRELGDCALGSICECPGGKQKCDDAAQSCPDGAEKCPLGQCKTGPCADNSFCRYGETCLAEAEGAPKRCVRDERGPFCAPCTIGPGQAYCAGSGTNDKDANLCLIDTAKVNSYFCGVECATDAECPWGFGCDDVLVLTAAPCGATKCADRPSMPCEKDDDCPGGECDPESGLCRPVCLGSEGGRIGACSCLADADCPTDVCGSDGRCSISNAPCDANTPCRTIYCKNQKDAFTGRSIGYCFVGRNCAPVEGVSCDQVRGGR